MTKKMLRGVLILLVLILLAASFFYFYRIDRDLVSNLNEEYGLYSVEAVMQDGYEEERFLALNTDALKANVLDIGEKPRQEILVQFSDNYKDLYLLKFSTDEEVEEIAESYEELEQINLAEPNFEVELFANSEELPNDPIEEELIAESEDQEASHPVVAIIDSGVDVDHPWFEGRIEESYDFVNEKEDMDDEFGHGTHVAGIVVRKNPTANIMALKFTDGKSGLLSDLIASLEFALENEADVVNLSLGLPQESQILKNQIERMQEKGIVFVAAAGNKSSSQEFFPGAWKDVIAVAAVDESGKKLDMSNYGEWVDFSALGLSVYSAMPNGRFGFLSGTSQAAPLVSARIAEIVVSDEYLAAEDKTGYLIEKLSENAEDASGLYEADLGLVID